MHLPLRARRAVTALLACAALLFAANTEAWAGDEDDGAETVTKTATVVVTSDGTKTVRLVQGKNGEFVVEPEQADGAAPRMRVMVQKDGQTGDVRVLELKDGIWVHGDHAHSAEAAERDVEIETFVRRMPTTLTTFGHMAEDRNPMSTVMRWLLTDGMAGELPNDPLKGWFEGGSDVPMAGLRNALKADGWNAQSLQAWFLQHLMGGMAALHTQARAPAPHAAHPPMRGQRAAHPPMHDRMHDRMQGPMRGRWFEIGRRHGPCNSCGCDCSSQPHRPRMQRRHPGRAWHGKRQGRGNGRGHGRWQARRGGCDCDQRRHAARGCDGGCGSCDKRGSCGSSKGNCGSCDKRGSCSSSKGSCGSCDKRGSCSSSKGCCGSCDKRGSCGASKGSCGSCDKRGSCGGDCGQKGRGPARRQAYMLWNDGSGWQHRKVDGQGPAGHWGHRHVAEEGMTFHGEDSEATPDFARLLREVIGESHTAPGSAQIVVESLDLLPADLLERVPPSVLEGVMKELQGLGLAELLAPAQSACDDCPKKGTGACKGGDCDKGASEKAASCCGTCKGECKDCPKARDGSCAGNCEDCPNKKGAEKKECCGTCKGGAAK